MPESALRRGQATEMSAPRQTYSSGGSRGRIPQVTAGSRWPLIPPARPDRIVTLASLSNRIPDEFIARTLARRLTELPKGKLTVSVRDRQGNITRIERTLSVGAKSDS